MSIIVIMLNYQLISKIICFRNNGTEQENYDALMADSKAYLIVNSIVAFLHFLISAISIDLVNYSALKHITRIRKMFFKSLLQQDMTWYDTIKDKNFAVKMTE